MCVRVYVYFFFLLATVRSVARGRGLSAALLIVISLSLTPPPPDLLLPTSKVSDSTVITPNGVPGPLHTLPEFKRRLKTIIEVRGGGGLNSYLLSYLTIDHAPLSRLSTVPTPSRDTSNIWALITLLPYFIETICLSSPHPVSPSAATIYLLG